MDQEKAKLFLESEMLVIGIYMFDNKLHVSVGFDGDEEVDLEASEVMDLITEGKISVKNIEMFKALREEFLAFFPLSVTT